MASLHGSHFRKVFVAFLVSLSLLWAHALRAETEPLPDYVIEQFGTPPSIPDGPLSPELETAVQVAFVDSITESTWGAPQREALETIAASGDPRVVWMISDLLRFVSGGGLGSILGDAASDLLGKDMGDRNHWGVVTDHLIAWDIPAPPGYLEVKRAIFTTVVPDWDKIFIEGEIDWRHVSWGAF